MGYNTVRFSSEHIREAAELERKYFSEPWSESSMQLLCTDEYPSFAICSEDGKLLAYLSAAKSVDELQIINVAVREELRGQGLGKLLMSAADEFCRENALVSISLEVRESNERAISMYTRCGFFCAGVRKNFYRKPTENAVVMIKNLT
jgi:ribosomal-protein-alanine N-acetyltransferase